jgi:sporulation protein YlmC with PRC-barrel domain
MRHAFRLRRALIPSPCGPINARLALAPLAALTLAFGATFAVAQTSAGGTPTATKPSTATRPPAAAGPRNAETDPAAKQAWERTHRASRIIGMDVVNAQGEKVGDIEDIVLDRHGTVAYAVVSTGGFLGVGERLHAVPWRSLEANAAAGQFLLDVDREKLAKAPGFDNSRFPDVNDPKWSAENRRHFPAAGSAASRSSTMGSEQGPPKMKERDDARSGSGRSATGNDVGTTTSTSRRSGPAAGTGSSTAPGSTAGTGAGSTADRNDTHQPVDGMTGNARGDPATNPVDATGGAGNPPASRANQGTIK